VKSHLIPATLWLTGLLTGLLMGAPAALAQSPDGDGLAAGEPPTLSDDEAENFDATFERFRDRMKELTGDVRSIVEQRESEERQKIMRSYQAVQDELVGAENDLRELAIRRFEGFLSKYPGAEYSPHVMFRLAELYFEQAGEDWLGERLDYDRLEAAFDEGTIEELPQMPLKDYADSAALYQRIVDEYPDYEYADAAWYMMGYISFDDLSEDLDLEQAKFNFHQLIDRYPESEFAVEANLLLGTIYFEDNEIETSIPYFETVVAAGEDHTRYDKGLYQLAWAYYKLSDYRRGLGLFTDLLDFSEEYFKQTGKDSNMKPEALKYLAISFSDVADLSAEEGGGEPIDVARGWFEQVGSRPYEADVIKELAEVLVIQARFEAAIATYEYIQQRWPDDPENPVFQNRVSQLYSQLPIPDYESAARASATLSERYNDQSAWWGANKANPDAQAQARGFIEKSLSQVARTKHQKAYNTKATVDYLDAASTYREYLRKFPFANDYYEVTWYLADTLYQASAYRESIEQYGQLLKFSGKHQFEDGARYQRWKASRNLVLDTHGPLEQVAGDAVVERVVETPSGPREVYSLTEDHVAYIAVCDDLRERRLADPRYGDALDKDRAALYYDPAQILYVHGRYEEARPRFEEVIANFPRTNEGAFAAGAIVESYQNDGDLANTRKYANIYRYMDLGEQPELRAEEFASVEESAALTMARGLEDGGDHHAAAEAYLAYLGEYPQSDKANLALYNAGYNFERAGKKDRANELFERYINTYPRDDRSKNLYFRIASNYSGILELERAVDYYEQLFRYFPDHIDALTALRNAGFLRTGMGDYRGAAENFEEFADRTEKASDREVAIWLASEQWERVGDAEALTFYNRYLDEYGGQNPDHSVQSLHWIYRHYEAEGDDRQAERARDRLLESFDEMAEEGEVGPIARNLSAEVAFEDIWEEYQEFEQIEFTDNEEVNTKVLIDTKANSLVELTESGRELISRYLDFEYTSAVLYVEGAAHLAYAEMFFNAPTPDHWTQEQQDFYRSVLDDKARPLEEKGVARLQANLEKAASEKRSSEWIDATIKALNKYRPKEYPLEKPEVRGGMDPALYPERGPRSLSAGGGAAAPAEPGAGAAGQPTDDTPAAPPPVGTEGDPWGTGGTEDKP